MLLTEAQLQAIQKIIADHHAAYCVNILGPESVPPDILESLKQQGLITPTMQTVQDAYVYGQVLAALQNPKTATMSFPEFQKYLRVNPIPLTAIEKQAVAMARASAARYVQGLGNRVSTDATTILVEADAALRNRMKAEIRTAVEEGIAKREGLQKLKSNLGWATSDWARDWDRIAVTETHNAMQHGMADQYGKKFGEDTRVAKRPCPDACEHCKRVYLGPDGAPIIFKLGDLEANGTNVERRAADWLPVVGTVHPNCQCQLVRVPNGWGFNAQHDLIPGGKLGIEYEGSETTKSLDAFQKSLRTESTLDFSGIPITIENRAGTTRRWEAANGESGETHMLFAYGFVQRTNGADEQEVDVFVGPDPDSQIAYVIDQQERDTGRFDESKVMLGFSNEDDAKLAYLAHYSRPDFFECITPMPLDHFKRWLSLTPIHTGEMMKGQKPCLVIPLSEEILEKAQLDLFGGPKFALQPTASSTPKPPGEGWEPIPRGKKGGFRKRVGNGYEYWYPDGTTKGPGKGPQPVQGELKPKMGAEQPPPALESMEEAPHARQPETETTLGPAIPERTPDNVGPAGVLAATGRGSSETGQHDAATGEGARPEAQSSAQVEAQPVNEADLPEAEIIGEPDEDTPPETLPDIEILGEPTEEELHTLKVLQQDLSGPAQGPEYAPDNRPVTTIPIEKSPAVTLHPDLLPEVLGRFKLADSVRNFPNPAPLKDSEGKITGYIDHLFPHQAEGAERVLQGWDSSDGVLLQDEAGLGKTNIALAAMVARGGARNLIIVPHSGKAGMKAQWQGARCAGLYGVDLKEVGELSATDPGWWVVSYDELIGPMKDADGKIIRDAEGKIRTAPNELLTKGKWDTVAFDECHNLTNPSGQRTQVAKDILEQSEKVLYMSATPFQNVADMHYLTKLNLWKDRIGKEDPDTGEVLNTDEEAFVAWARDAGAFVPENKEKLTYKSVKNPSSPLPMAAIASTLHVDGLSIKRMTSLEGVTSKFGLTQKEQLAPEHQKAFATANQIIGIGSMGGVNDMLCKALYTGWNRQYWEILKVPQAVELGKKAAAEGKQVAFFTSFKSANHEHLRAIPKMLMRKAERAAASNSEDAQAKAMAFAHLAAEAGRLIDTLPKAGSAVQQLVDSFGGAGQVAEIHGNTKKKPAAEQEDYQNGKKKICVATMAKGGTGISLHDTTGEHPRVQINLSLPWSGREYNQVSGRSHRLGSKSNTEMHWLVGEDDNERHNAAVVAKRLKSMGCLTAGDPDLTVSSTALAEWDFGNKGSDSDDAAIAADVLLQASDDDEPTQAMKDKKGIPTAEEAQAARDWFREFGERRKAGHDVFAERKEETRVKRQAKDFLGARRAAEQMRQKLGWDVTWRPGFGRFEIERKGVAPAHEKHIRSKTVGGQGKTYGGRLTLAFWVEPSGMLDLAEKLKVHDHAIDMRKVKDEQLDPANISDHEKLVDELTKVDLKVAPYDAGGDTLAITGQTYKWYQQQAFSGIARGTRIGSDYAYLIPRSKLAELAKRTGGTLSASHEKAIAETQHKEEVERREAGFRKLSGSDKQIKWADSIRERAMREVTASPSPENDKVRLWLQSATRASDVIDARAALGWPTGGIRPTPNMLSKAWDPREDGAAHFRNPSPFATGINYVLQTPNRTPPPEMKEWGFDPKPDDVLNPKEKRKPIKRDKRVYDMIIPLRPATHDIELPEGFGGIDLLGSGSDQETKEWLQRHAEDIMGLQNKARINPRMVQRQPVKRRD